MMAATSRSPAKSNRQQAVFMCDQVNLASRQMNGDTVQLWLRDQNPDVLLCSDPPWFLRHNDFQSQRHRWLRCPQTAESLAGIFVRSDIPHQCLPLPLPSNRVLALSLTSSLGELVVISCYIQHTSGEGLDALEAAIRMAKQRTPLVLVGGDLNGHSPLWGNQATNWLGRQLEDMIGALDLTVLNSADGEATFLNSRGHQSWIDVTLGTRRLANLRSNHEVLPDVLPSDHHLLRTTLALSSAEQPTRGVWRWEQTDWPTFQVRLEERLPGWLLEGNLNSAEQIEEGVSALTQAIHQTRSELVCYSKIRARPKPWFTPAVRAAHKRLRTTKKVLSKAQRRSLDGQAPPDVATRFRDARRAFEVLVKNTKQACFQAFCEQTRPGTDMWDKFRQVCGSRRMEPIPALSDNGSLITDTPHKADLLLHSFFPEACAVTHEDDLEPATALSTPPLENTITLGEVWDMISTARRTAPGRDEIPAICWQGCASVLAPVLLCIYNACLQCHYYPRSWRHAQIIPLPKGTKNRSSPSSWRPISLLCNAGKILEKIIQRRLTRFLEQTKALSEAQHGFRRNHSTESALSILTEDTLKAFNCRKQIIAVGLDISKAFDSVSHPLLLRRMQELEVPQYITDFLRSFLTDRRATLTLDGISRCVKVPRGVPQGSSLSPTIFAIYMDSLAAVICPPVRLLMFADDCLLYQEIHRSQADCEPLQAALDQAIQWGSNWDLSFNAMKTQLCRFSRLRKTQPITLQQASTLLTEQPSIRYLGLDIDTAWTFSEHLKNKKTLCQRRLNQIRRLSHTFWGASPAVTKRLVDMCILPACLYGASVFGPLSRGRSSRLQILLAIYRAGSILITGAQRTTPTSSLLTLAGMRPPEIDLLDRLTTCQHLPVRGMQKLVQTYPTPSQQYQEVMKQLTTQEWIPSDIRKLLVEDSTKDRRSPLLNTARQAYLNTLTCDRWHQSSTGQALKETGWTAMAKLELSWWNHFSRPSVTRLTRFLSGHFPTRAYLARFHCLPEQLTSQCRLGCPDEETREHLLSCPHLNTLRRANYLYDSAFPHRLSLDYLSHLDDFLASLKLT